MIAEALGYPFFQRALLAGLLASVACGVVGTFVVVKRMASISGGLSHAAFGGVGLGYLAGFDPNLGAALFALGSGIGVGTARRRLGSEIDTLVAMVWASGMALGILFISLAPGYAPDLMSYLFGSILFVPADYVLYVIVLDLVILLTVVALFKELRAASFDEEFSEVMGLPTELLYVLLLALISLAIVTLIRVVGVILVIALLTVPATIARHWSRDLGRMMALSTAICAAAVTSGLLLSYWLSDAFAVQAPTGPVIILLTMALYAASAAARSLVRRNAG